MRSHDISQSKSLISLDGFAVQKAEMSPFAPFLKFFLLV